MKALKAIAGVLIILGLVGTGVSGYTLVSLPSLLAPIDQAAQFLSSVSIPTTINVSLAGPSHDVKKLADSLPDCISVIVCIVDLRNSKNALYDLSASLSSLKVDTGLEALQLQIQTSAQQLYQVKVFVTYVIGFLFGAGVLFVLTGLGFLLIARRIS